MKKNNTVFYSKFLIIKKSDVLKIIVMKKKIKLAVKRIKMKRKIRFLNKLINYGEFLYIINEFIDLRLEDYILIKNKVRKKIHDSLHKIK